jgi:hypothetical protein
MKSRTRDLIIVIDHKENVDGRFGSQRIHRFENSGKRGVSSSQNFRSTGSRREMAHGHSP